MRAVIKMEINFHANLALYRSSVFGPRLEFPCADRFDGLLVETVFNAVDHMHVGHIAICIHHHLEHHRSLYLGFPGVLAELRFRRIDRAGLGGSAVSVNRAATTSGSRRRIIRRLSRVATPLQAAHRGYPPAGIEVEVASQF